jgi:signal transduction histidine kinase
MDFETNIFRLIASIAGSALGLFLTVLMATKRRATVEDRLALGTVLAATVWHGVNAAVLYQWASLPTPDPELRRLAGSIAPAGGALAVAFLLHLALVWTGVRPRWAAAVWAGPAAALWAPGILPVYTGAALAGSAVVSLRTGLRQALPPYRAFHLCLAVSLVVTAAAALNGRESALLAFVSLGPLLCLIHFVYRYNILGLLIGRRIVLVFTLAIVSAFYLLIVRLVADMTELFFEAFGALIQLSLIFASAALWLPLFEWVTRFLSRRTQRFTEFARGIVERADSILETPGRLQFLADQIGRLFGLRRVLLVTFREPRLAGCYGCGPDATPAAGLDALVGYIRESAPALIHQRTPSAQPVHAFLRESGFTYAFPLWYQSELIGVLLVDSTPRFYLDELEPILVNLSREISHSMETCRLVEEKIRLERALLQQEHLAGLGKVAATIAHEIKNPLSSIKALAQLMGEDPAVAAGYARDIGFIVSETDRLAANVGQLLAFSKPAAESKPDVPVYDLLETTATTLGREYASEQTRIRSSLDEGLRTRLADRQSLQQIVLNLALNAIQAAGAGGSVDLSARLLSDGTVRIEVTDDGPGIPDEMKSRIFEPFFTTRTKGTGLGLAIVKKNLAHLGGVVRVHSPVRDGRGTRFEVTLPAVAAKEVKG